MTLRTGNEEDVLRRLLKQAAKTLTKGSVDNVLPDKQADIQNTEQQTFKYRPEDDKALSGQVDSETATE